MKPVEQTKLSYPDGNCFAACLASVLEVALEEVPCFHGDGWLDRYNEWLAPRNLVLINLTYASAEGEPWYPAGYSLLAAKSPRGDWLHAVVCLDGEVVWDPHPQREMGIGERKEWTIFYVRDPAQATSF